MIKELLFRTWAVLVVLFTKPTVARGAELGPSVPLPQNPDLSAHVPEEEGLGAKRVEELIQHDGQNECQAKNLWGRNLTTRSGLNRLLQSTRFWHCVGERCLGSSQFFNSFGSIGC